jgi:hypothetical protein
MHSAMNIANCTKETESERESFPQTPFIEKGKGKENLNNNPAPRVRTCVKPMMMCVIAPQHTLSTFLQEKVPSVNSKT